MEFLTLDCTAWSSGIASLAVLCRSGSAVYGVPLGMHRMNSEYLYLGHSVSANMFLRDEPEEDEEDEDEEEDDGGEEDDDGDEGYSE